MARTLNDAQKEKLRIRRLLEKHGYFYCLIRKGPKVVGYSVMAYSVEPGGDAYKVSAGRFREMVANLDAGRHINA
jgi:hypothetical protein